MESRIVVTRCRLEAADGDVGSPSGIERRTIALDEWLAHVRSNPELALVKLAANEDKTLRAAHPAWLVERRSEHWLHWVDGEIRADAVDPALHAVMTRVAQALGAWVRTDRGDGLRVSGNSRSTARPKSGPRPRVIRRDPADPVTLDEDDAAVDRRARQVLLVAAAIVCAASLTWLVTL